nr:protein DETOXIFICATION 24-like [Ipomoea trifida]
MDNGIHKRLLSSDDQVENTSDDLKVRVYEESSKIWRIALPGVLSRVTSFGSIVATQSFIGHVTEIDLAAYALVQTLIVRFVNGILLGMSSATETLCGQAYGAGQYHMLGIYLQRSWIVDLVTLTIFIPYYFFATPFFKLLGEEESIAEASGYISLWFIPFVYSVVFSTTIQMYLQAQQKNMIIAWLSIAQFVIHIPLSWLLVYKFEFGVSGAMSALSISSWFVVIGEFVYIFGGWCPNTWRGFTMDAFKDIFPVVKLSISSGLMLCINVYAWLFMISLGLLGGVCVRVANELGKGDAKATIFSIKVAIGNSVVIGLIFFVVCLVFGNKIGYLFSNEKEVVDAVSDLSILLAFSVLLNSVSVGAGLQSTVAVINLVCFYLIGIPIGALLGYVANLQVKGIWVGMIFGVVAETLALCYMTWRTNWDNEVAKSKNRLKRFFLNSEDSNQPLQLA